MHLLLTNFLVVILVCVDGLNFLLCQLNCSGQEINKHFTDGEKGEESSCQKTRPGFLDCLGMSLHEVPHDSQAVNSP